MRYEIYHAAPTQSIQTAQLTQGQTSKTRQLTQVQTIIPVTEDDEYIKVDLAAVQRHINMHRRTALHGSQESFDAAFDCALSINKTGQDGVDLPAHKTKDDLIELGGGLLPKVVLKDPRAFPSKDSDNLQTTGLALSQAARADDHQACGDNIFREGLRALRREQEVRLRSSYTSSRPSCGRFAQRIPLTSQPKCGDFTETCQTGSGQPDAPANAGAD